MNEASEALAGDGTAARQKPRRIGVVTSDKMNKTRTVVVDRMVRHSVYRKYIRRSTVLKVHDEAEDSRVGDKVEVEFTRPLSKTKSWRLVRVIEKAMEARR